MHFMTSILSAHYNCLTVHGWSSSVATGQKERTITARSARSGSVPTDELVAFCPKCMAFETLWFSGDVLVQTRKFTQHGPRVYHDCGSDEPCRLLLRFLKPR